MPANLRFPAILMAVHPTLLPKCHTYAHLNVPAAHPQIWELRGATPSIYGDGEIRDLGLEPSGIEVSAIYFLSMEKTTGPERAACVCALRPPYIQTRALDIPITAPIVCCPIPASVLLCFSRYQGCKADPCLPPSKRRAAVAAQPASKRYAEKAHSRGSANRLCLCGMPHHILRHSELAGVVRFMIRR